MIFLLGLTLGIFLFWILFRIKKKGFTKFSNAMIQEAEKEIAKRKAFFEATHAAQVEEGEKKLKLKEQKLEREENRLEERFTNLMKKLSEIDKREEFTQKRERDLTKKIEECERVKEQFLQKTEEVAKMNAIQGKNILLAHLKEEAEKSAAKIVEEEEKKAEEKSKEILATVFNRLAIGVGGELALMTVLLPNDEMKSRIIGREGRNIRALENLTGVNILVDETPGAIVISGLDPHRKQVAKIALTDLLQDGRIHPTRIEEAVKKAESSLTKEIVAKGEEAVLKTSVLPMHPELVALLGSLHFRFVEGQNILEHSLEVAHIMGLIASEFKLDCELAKRMGLLHDIGKALNHEMEGSHALAGMEIALKFKESESCANGIGAHHHEIPPKTIEAALLSAANEISKSRKGARLGSIEQYMKRCHKLESIAKEYPGVEYASAISAGKEIRVIVAPESLNDREMSDLAKTIAKRIESELTYPGKIKVTLIREKKAVEYAI